MRPDLTVTLVDSVRKKISFVKHAIRTIGLHRIEAVHARLETLARQKAYCGAFDVVVCRAFTSLEDLATLARALLAPGGSLLAMKGPQMELPEEEHLGDNQEAAIHLGGAPFSIRIHHYRLPILDAQRRLVRLVPLEKAR